MAAHYVNIGQKIINIKTSYELLRQDAARSLLQLLKNKTLTKKNYEKISQENEGF